MTTQTVECARDPLYRDQHRCVGVPWTVGDPEETIQ